MLAVWACVAWLGLTATADAHRVQVIHLQPGWNAVQLMVQPLDADLNRLLTNHPVEIVSTYLRPVTEAQFIQNPDETDWKKPGWAVWYASGRDDHLLSNLWTWQAHRAYLIRCSARVDLNVEGAVELKHIHWYPNSYNLVGFDVDPIHPPPFDQFFAGGRSHRGEAMYRLKAGIWSLVSASNETLSPGEAYWIYCRGASEFQGPLAVDLPFGRALDFGTLGSTAEIGLRNVGPSEARITVETVGTDGLPLSQVIRDPETLATTYPPLPPTFTLPPLAAGSADRLALHLRRRDLPEETDQHSTLLRMTSDSGCQVWVPVLARSR